MPGSGRFRMHHRSMLVVAAVSLLLLVGLVGFVLVSGSSSSLPASNAAAECETPKGPTARGYGETGTGVTAADPDCHQDSACDPAADSPTGRGYGESGAVNVAPACGPCPSDPPGATSRGYGESGVGSVLSDECEPADRAAGGQDGATVAPAASGDEGGGPTSSAAPLMGGGGAHDGAVPGATGRAAPRSVDATDAGVPVGPLLTTPLGAAVVDPTPAVEGSRTNTALVVGGLVLLLVAVAVVLRRGRPGTAW
jgi:hypothetical protein